MLEAFDEPTSRYAGWTVGPIDRRHCYHAAGGRTVLERNRNQGSACEILLEHVNRQAAKPEARAQEGKFGPEMRKMLDPGASTALIDRRHIGRIDVYELYVSVEDGWWNRPTVSRERVLG